MAATSDEEMNNLLSLVDQISDDFRNGINEIQSLKSNYNSEIKNRQLLDLTCSTLKRENERLKNLHLETLRNLTAQLEQQGNSQSLSKELKKLTDESFRKEEEHRRAIESLKRNHDEKIRVLEDQIREKLIQNRADEATIYQLHHELISNRNQLKNLESKYEGEIEDLKDCIFAEQQEKKELSKKVSDLEKELLVTKTKMVEQHVSSSSSSDKQFETLKQKMMKLRKENEVLKRQLLSSKET